MAKSKPKDVMNETVEEAPRRPTAWQAPRPSRLLHGDRSQSQRFANAMAMKFALTNPRLERARQVVHAAARPIGTRTS